MQVAWPAVPLSKVVITPTPESPLRFSTPAAAAAAGRKASDVNFNCMLMEHTKKFICDLQDTRRLLQSEAAAVAAEVKRREASVRLETDRHSVAEVGLSDLGRLTEQLAATEARLDRAKLDNYFPKIRGFRYDLTVLSGFES